MGVSEIEIRVPSPLNASYGYDAASTSSAFRPLVRGPQRLHCWDSPWSPKFLRSEDLLAFHNGAAHWQYDPFAAGSAPLYEETVSPLFGTPPSVDPVQFTSVDH